MQLGGQRSSVIPKFGAALSMLALIVITPAASHAAPPDSEPAAQPDRRERPILLLMTERNDLGAAIARALETELNDVEVDVDNLEMVPAVDLRDRIEAAERLVGEHGALGLIWTEPRADGLVVHLVVADVGMLRRPVIGLEGPDAAIETAAVIVRHFALDLLAGRPIGLSRFPAKDQPPVPEQQKPASIEAPIADQPKPEPPKQEPGSLLDDRAHFRLQAGYVGQTWIRERAWEHGVEVDVGWRFANGVQLGAGVAIAPAYEIELQHPITFGVAQLRVRRYPLALTVSYQHVWAKPRLALEAQLRVVSEFIERGVFDPNKVTPNLAGPVRVVPALEPRVVFDFLAIPQLAVFVAVGLRASLVRVDYSVEYVDENGDVVGVDQPLHPRVLAPVVLAGLDMYF